MFPLVFCIVIFLHIAFALGIGYFVLYLAVKAEGWLKKLGFIIGWLLIVLAIVAAAITPIFASKMHHYWKMHEKIRHEFMMNHHEEMGPEQTMPTHDEIGPEHRHHHHHHGQD